MFNRPCLLGGVWIFGLINGGLAQEALYERQGFNDCSKTCTSGDPDPCCRTASEVSSSTPSQASTTQNSSTSLETGDSFLPSNSVQSSVLNPTATSATSVQAVPSSIAAFTSSSIAIIPTSTPISHGLTNDEKLGIGVGVGVGVPIIIGIVAALFFLSKRRRNRQRQGPYGPVMTSEKGADERASYSSPQMQPHEMHNMGSAAPFLPAATGAMAYGGKGSEDHEAELAPSPPSAVRDVPVSSQQQSEGLYYCNTSAARPMTSREAYHSASPTIDTARPATAPGNRGLSAVTHDEPPSPVSPVSPISSTGSRPPSLMHNDGHHDL